MRKFSLFVSILYAAALLASCEKVENVVSWAKDEVDELKDLHKDTEPGISNWWPGLDKETDLSVFETPSLAGSAIKLSFGENAIGLNSVEFTESGLYVIKAQSGISTGTYTAANGAYKLGSVGTITVGDLKDGKATVSATIAGTTVEVEASATKPAYADDLEKVMCRSWKMTKNWYYMLPEGWKMVSGDYGACDFHKYAEAYYYGMGFTNLMYDETRKNYPELLNGTVVQTVALTGNGSFIVTFDKDKPWYGTWKWKDRATGEVTIEFASGQGGNVYIPKNVNAFVTPHENTFMIGFYTKFTTSPSVSFGTEEGTFQNYLIWKIIER